MGKISHTNSFQLHQNLRTKFVFAVATASLLFIASCGGSGSTDSSPSSPPSQVDAATTDVSAPTDTDAPVDDTIAEETSTTLALDDFDTSPGAFPYLGSLKAYVEVYLNPQYLEGITDTKLFDIARNVCFQVRERGLDSWISEIEGLKTTDTADERALRTFTTIASITWFCDEFVNELQSNLVAQGW